MSYIIYNQKSSKDLLNSELMVCHLDYSQEAVSLEKEYITTTISENNDRENYLGASYSTPLEFNFTLIKSDYSEFTLNEVRLINSWLMNTSTPKKLQIIPCVDNYETKYMYYYMGVFTKIEKIRINGTVGLKCYFKNNSAFMYKDMTVQLNDVTTGTLEFTCENDDHEHVLYPTLEITSDTTDYGFTIQNKDDNDKIFNIYLQNSNTITIDCANGVIKDKADIALSFSDIGWDSVDKIYWLKLINGINTWKFTTLGNVDIKITYTSKIFGGVLDEFTV